MRRIQFGQILTLLQSPSLFEMHGNGITDLLRSLVRNGGKPYADVLLTRNGKIRRGRRFEDAMSCWC